MQAPQVSTGNGLDEDANAEEAESDEVQFRRMQAMSTWVPCCLMNYLITSWQAGPQHAARHHVNNSEQVWPPQELSVNGHPPAQSTEQPHIEADI